jgi:hypothetical protein
MISSHKTTALATLHVNVASSHPSSNIRLEMPSNMYWKKNAARRNQTSTAHVRLAYVSAV